MSTFSVAGFTSIINQLLPEPHAGLLAGLMFGTKAAFPRELYDALISSGTIHIAALSGQNLSILSRLISENLIGVMGKRAASAVSLLLIVWFVCFVGPSPSIIRAAIMGSLTILAVLFGRQYWAILSWILTVGIMLLFNFLWITDISFQLSALATLGIILFGATGSVTREKIDERGEGTKFLQTASRAPKEGDLNNQIIGMNTGDVDSREAELENFVPTQAQFQFSAGPVIVKGLKIVWLFVQKDLRLTLAAQIFTVPLILLNFHRISLISPLANLAIGWVIGPLTGLGWITVFLGFVWLPLGQVVAWVDWIALEYVVRTVYFMSSVPFASIGR